ncbi:MAG: metallophosphoesterase [Thermoplasmata archaeon]|nr:metallophosphoesterase [Thermoplasmata archaeon]
MKIIFGTPFFVHPGVLAVADTHIGIEMHLRKAGFSVQSGAPRYAEAAVIAGRHHNAKILVHLGDVKHTIGRTTEREREEVLGFFRILETWFRKVIVVRGNHDGGIILPDYVEVRKSFAYGDIGFLHGHCYPAPAIADCRTIVCGHVHPCVRFRDGLGRVKSYKCWVVAEVNSRFRAKFGLKKARKLFVMPSASDFVGMREINDPSLNGFLVSWNHLSRKKSEFYLFDGTFLGSMEHLERTCADCQQ